jgi:uncharacterized membrane protein YfcA
VCETARPMSILEALAILGAGMAAGAINTIVGSGSLITFPTLLALGYRPVTANVSNTVGLAFGGISGVVGYRRELSGQAERARALATASLTGAVIGAVLLLTLPGSVFRSVVPVLIGVACVLVLVQPAVSRAVARRRRPDAAHGGPWLYLCVFATGIYGGYFGAAQGVILLAVLGVFLNDDLQRLNAVKNVLATTANVVAAVVFMIAVHVAWDVAALIALGSVVGGQVGALVGRRLPPIALRVLIVVIGVIAIARLTL